jgi:type III restriction enzyme
VTIRAGFTELKRRSYTQIAGEPQIDFHQQPPDLSHIDRYLFKGFRRCLYTEEKFQSDTERRFAVILDRETEKWFKPARGQFQMFYKSGADYLEYQPDFVAETKDSIYMLESKAKNQMEDAIVLAKKDVAVKWCEQTSTYAGKCGGKPWKYALIPHDAIVENMTLVGLVGQYSSRI